MRFANIFNFLEAGFNCYSSFVDYQSRRDLLSELSYLQDALSHERAYGDKINEDLVAYKRATEQYWALLVEEGYFLNQNNELMKRVEFDEDEEEILGEEEEGEVPLTDC